MVISTFASDINTSVTAIQTTYKSINDISMNFTQSTYVAVLEKYVEEKGRFEMKKPGMMRVDYTGEHPRSYISNGKRLWVVEPDIGQVAEYKADDNNIPREALEFLNGFGEMEQLFTIKSWLPKRSKKGNVYLRLIPKTESPQYDRLDCEFGEDNILKAITINNKSGNVSTYQFGSARMNLGLDAKAFNYR